MSWSVPFGFLVGGIGIGWLLGACWGVDFERRRR